MPNRIIKESTFVSERIASLSDFEFRLWVGLITYVDDAGRGDARPAIIRGRLFALRDRVTNKDVQSALQSLAVKGCITLYTVGGRSYFSFPSWSKHQRIRDSRPKYPGPDEADSVSDGSVVTDQDQTACDGLQQFAASRSNSQQPAASRCLNPNPNPNPNPNLNPKEDADASCVEPEGSSPTFLTFPLNDGTEYPITFEQVQHLQELYPSTDVEQQIRNMCGWLESNPTKRKTRRGIMRFVNSWLSREQNRGGRQQPVKQRPSANVFLDMLSEEDMP